MKIVAALMITALCAGAAHAAETPSLSAKGGLYARLASLQFNDHIAA